MMKLGFNEATCLRNSSLEKDLVLAERFGYDYIEIRLDMLQTWLQEHTLVELADIFSVSHLKPWGYNSLEDITFCDAGRWSEIRQQLVLACYAGEVVGGDCLVVVPTIREGAHFSDRDTVRDSVKRLREMSALAAESQMRLAFEPIGSAGCCVRSLAMAMEIVDAVDRSNVGLAIDAFNLYLYDQWQDLSTLRQVPVEKIFVYHIDDADRLPVAVLDHCHRLFPGNGAIPLHMITHELVKKGYTGICSLELFNPGYWQMAASEVFAIGAEKTRPFLAD
ncbi:sugar phosphate isomerase/epimerase [Escherichia coli]|uniref:sugar phosphate isomerase/epimerase family protein n=1 Tax=Escherichia coli TaxID=562 RepID=UPI00181C0D5F|nr:sugar phosphate isomerase/epimerase [Escherichia coli]EET7765157.1 sugar phosphate isomerase/epimerase [Escherichia coli]EEV6495138.1 sugar phosphate isomerase/epimerase [Escherichia coli]EFA9656823.1 sugar phosphate isomerase/epimerase [Escherichia coli]EFF1170002.1 sugar phosphate isomerase/epimerase [Escherichia coli]